MRNNLLNRSIFAESTFGDNKTKANVSPTGATQVAPSNSSNNPTVGYREALNSEISDVARIAMNEIEAGRDRD